MIEDMGQGALFEPDGWCQLWESRVPSWRHTSEGGFRASSYQVVDLDHRPALEFVTRHHYSGAFSSAVLRYGLVERAGGRLVGTCVLGNGMTPAVLTNPFPHLRPHRQALELSRLVLLDEVPANAESWFVAQALGDAAAKGLRGVVMYSDPNERVNAVGHILPGHLGIVYQALGFRYVGTSKARYEDHLPDGTVLPERTASKVRGLEQGAYGAVRRLVQLGATDPGDLARMSDVQRADWLGEALDTVGAHRIRRNGKHRYVAACGTRSQRRRTMADVPHPAKPYPKRPLAAR